jgi:hypothetical protein
VNPRHHWIEEGTATYVELIARAHDRAFLPASTVRDEILRNAVDAQVLSYLATARNPFCRAFQCCIESFGLRSPVDE